MLGRLFKLTSTQSLNLGVHNSAAPNVGSSNSFDDSYTRSILYGSSTMLVAPVHPLPRRFRLIVAQDGGALGAKQVLFDLVGDSAPASPLESLLTTPLAGPEFPALHLKLSQMSLQGAIQTKNAGTFGSSVGTPSLEHQDSFLSPDSGELPLAVLLPVNSYFARESGHASNQSTPRPLASAHPGISRTIVAQKQAHNINVLTDYMFGRGLPSNEWHTATKIHFLPPLNVVHGTSQAVLVTKLFLIVDANVASSNESDHGGTESWNPESTICARETVVSFSSSKSNIAPRSNFTSRFSIGIIVPLDDPSQTIEETLACNWYSLSMQLIVAQKIVTNKLILALKGSVNHHSPYISNKRILFPSYMLQGDVELLIQLHKLVKLVQYQVNIPRLISNHSLMMHALKTADSPFKATMLNWALEVINWLEFKDGRMPVSVNPLNHSHLSTNLVGLYSGLSNHISPRSSESPQLSNTFLASLFALILSLRELLSPQATNGNSHTSTKEITRVVVMTSNSTVAKKLIFLICGLIPNPELLAQLEFCSLDKDENLTMDSDRSSNMEPRSDVNTKIGAQPRQSNKNISIETISRSEDNAPDCLPHSYTSPLNLVGPIPIHRQQLFSSEGPSDESVCASMASTKGWEVPVKPTIGASISKSGINPTSTQSVAIAQKSSIHDKFGNGSSMAYLSSSLNSSLSSSASNYSLLKLGSSFMDKWKHSLVGSNAHTPHHFPESFDPPMFIESMRKAIPAGTKSPSPSVADENPWDSTLLNTAPSSPLRARYSRTHSVHNVCNDTTQKYKEPKLATTNLERTAHSLYLPPSQTQEIGMTRKNEQIIKSEMSQIFANPVKIESQRDLNITLADPFLATEVRKDKDLSSRSVPSLQRRFFLQPHVAFVDEFRPECIVQSCPVNPKLEAHVMSAMKNDLIFYQNTCGYKRVVSKTVFVSLRVRDIKLIELRVGGQDKSPNAHFGPTTPTESPISAVPHLPITSYFSHDNSSTNQERRGSLSTNYKTTIRKVFSSGRNSGDRELVNLVESRLEQLSEVVSVMNGDPHATPEAKQELNKMLFDAVRELIS